MQTGGRGDSGPRLPVPGEAASQTGDALRDTNGVNCKHSWGFAGGL